MKCYLASGNFRLTGKAWEIKHYLRGIAASTPRQMTLIEWFDKSRIPVARR